MEFKRALAIGGTVTAPSPALAGSPTTGLYRSAADVLGFAGTGKKLFTAEYRLQNGDDNVWLNFGTGQAITDTSNDVYIATFSNPAVTVTGAAARVVGFNIGSNSVTYTAGTTYTQQQAVLEMDKLDAFASGAAVVINDAVNTRFRTAIAHTNVTIAVNKGIDFVVGSNPDGVVTELRYINIPAAAANGATTFKGIYFNDAPNGGNLVSANGYNILISAGGSGASDADLNLNASNTGKVVASVGGLEVARFKTVASAVNSFLFTNAVASGNVSIFPQGASSAVGMVIGSKGAGIMAFNPGGSTTLDYGSTHGGQWTSSTLFEALSFKTGTPSGGTAGVWKMGIRVAATVILDTTQYVQLDIGGTLYKLAIAS